MCELQKTQDAARRHEDGSARYLFPSVDGNEMVSRWDMQEHPPDILITNVSMLSAMLSREVDAPIFDKTREWIESDPEAYFFLILDELHLQRGSAGTEVTVAQVKQIIDAANEPYKTVFWLVAETGIRRGEICGLNVGDVDLNEQAITVQRSRWKSKLKRPKNGKKRFFALSPQLTERLRFRCRCR
jgi:Phage integrase family